MRVELMSIQERIGVTTIFVTHDQSEALAMSDKIIVMSAGNIEQVGSPEEVYNKPESEFVAGFLGAANLLNAQVTAAAGESVTMEVAPFGKFAVLRHKAAEFTPGGKARLVVRAEKIRLLAPGEVTSDEIAAVGEIEAVDYQGQIVRYFVRINEQQLQVFATIDHHPYTKGTPIAACIRPRDCVVLPAT